MGMVVLLGGWTLVRAGARLPGLSSRRAGVRRPGRVGGEGRRDRGAWTAPGPRRPCASRLAAVVGGQPGGAGPDAGHLPGYLGGGAGPSGRPAPPPGRR